MTSGDFESTQGVLVGAEARDTHFMFKGDFRSRKRGFVRYRYTVHGIEYEGNLGTFSPIMNHLDAAEYLKRYRPGTAVTVWYDPADPSRSLLERRLKPSTLFAAGASLAVVLIFAGGFIFLYRIGIFDD